MMPGIDGLAVLQRLRQADVQLPVLLLTAKDAPDDEVHGLESGADDYVVKPFTFEVLLARVRALLRRKQDAAQQRVLRFADLVLDTGSHRAWRGEREVTLTSLEFKLLHVRGHYDDRDRALVSSAEHIIASSQAMAGAPHLIAGSGGLEIGFRLYGPDGALREHTPGVETLPRSDPQAIITAQEAEIAQMEQWRQEWFGE